MTEVAATEPPAVEQNTPDGGVAVQEVELLQTSAREIRNPAGQIDILLNTTTEVTVRLGQARMPARELIQLGPGSVVALDRRAGEPVDLLLRGVRFATGKLVVVNGQLGVRIEEILAAEDMEG